MITCTCPVVSHVICLAHQLWSLPTIKSIKLLCYEYFGKLIIANTKSIAGFYLQIVTLHIKLNFKILHVINENL